MMATDLFAFFWVMILENRGDRQFRGNPDCDLTGLIDKPLKIILNRVVGVIKAHWKVGTFRLSRSTMVNNIKQM